MRISDYGPAPNRHDLIIIVQNKALTPERWKKVEEVFEAVLRRPAEDRAAFLDSVCADDITLRNQVDTLLLSLERAGLWSRNFPFSISHLSLRNKMNDGSGLGYC